ncbi:MAG: 50S ribosomal protein L18 [Hyphomicrobiales bacterium]|jgi:large subunit ribosomal protein L18|tara:strand:- start:36 stop:386 length:351 start_codon:yes stop_codon:yes gene_type:complete
MVNKIISNKRKARVRKKLKKSSSDKMRLSVFRSAKHIYAQIIDDSSGITVASASTLEKSSSGLGSNISSASKVGSEIAKKAIDAGVKEVFFDRGSYKYHGRVKALAENAREAGLKF